MQLAVYLIILLAALIWFSYTIYSRLAVLKRARSVDVRGDVAERLGMVLKHVFGQWRLLHGDFAAGLMHFFIFWGFVAVLINTLHFLIGGFTGGEFTLPFLGREQLLGQLYRGVRDIFELLVLLAVTYAFFRRLVLKPKRLTLSGEALLILGLIAILMITDYAMGGAFKALSTQTSGSSAGWYSPAETLFARLFVTGGALSGTASIVHQVSWWVHLLSLLFFLNLLPLGKHFHVLTSMFSVYLHKLTPLSQIQRIDFEDESIEDYGVSQPAQLTWRNWLDSYSCTECGRCDYYCPANQTGKALSPRHIITGTRDLLYASQRALLKPKAAESGGEGDDTDSAFVGATHTDTELWACTTCGACDAHCPLFIEHVEPIIQMRQHLVLEEEGRFPKELVATFKGLETQGNPWSIGAHQRLEWAEGLEVPTLSDQPDAEWIYFVGCFASLDERNKGTARAFVSLLQRAGVSFAVLDAESCCGDPARRCGHEYLAQALIEMNVEQFSEAKTKKAVTACPHCFTTLKHEYSQFGVEFEEVLHHTQLLSRLMNQGKLVLSTESGMAKRVVYHDSCYLGRYNSIYYNPRDLLRAIRGTQLIEASFNRDKGYCCGAGGGRMFMEETEGQRVNHFRLEQLVANGAEQIAVACPYCLTMLDDAAKETGREGVTVKDVAVLLDEASSAS